MKYFYFFSLIFLTSCAQMGANSQINSAANREMSSWKNVYMEGDKLCPKGTDEKPLPKSLSMKQYDCWASLVEKHVRPVAFNHDQLNNYLLAMRKTSLAYKQGKIDRDTGRTQAMENWNRYTANLNQIAQGIMVSAQQQDEMTSQRMQQMSQQLNQQEIQRQQQMQSNVPKTTTCKTIGNSLNCTTW